MSGLRRLATVMGGAVLAAAIGLAPAYAWWTDSAPVSSTVGAATLLPPTPVASGACSISGVPGLAQTANLAWTGVAATAGTSPPLSGYEYLVRAYNDSTGAQMGSAQTVAQAGGTSAKQSTSYSASLLGNLFGLNLASDTTIRLVISAHLKNSTWESSSTVTIKIRVQSILLLANVSCV